MRKPCPSDITREQYAEIKTTLATASKQTRPRTYDLYDIYCAILYIAKEGCTWRALPHDYPKWGNVYYHFQNWSRKDEEKGYDAGKKVSGIKRHIVVDTQGLPHAIIVTTADVTDRQGAIKMVTLNLDNPLSVKKYLVDGGYSGENFANALKELCGADVEVVKRNELYKFAVLPKRWVVERTFGWLDKAHRLWKNCERKIHNSLQMVILALIAVLIKKFCTGSKTNPQKPLR